VPETHQVTHFNATTMIPNINTSIEKLPRKLKKALKNEVLNRPLYSGWKTKHVKIHQAGITRRTGRYGVISYSLGCF
jgi:hypothetical protein